MGVITPVGNDLQTFWTNLVNGVSGIGPITHFDVSAFDCRIAGEVRNFEAVNYFKDKKGPKRSDRFVHLAVGAAKLAMEDAGFTPGAGVPEP
jgi:3-oxoacyl-[acyl-carrier-protein] synthase II